MNITTILSDLGTAIATMFTNIVTELAKIFFTVGDAGGVNITGIGYLALISLVLGIVYFLFRWVSSLIRGRSSR